MLHLIIRTALSLQMPASQFPHYEAPQVISFSLDILDFIWHQGKKFKFIIFFM